jgi:tetratricopeptide (TPR) repeat protein
VLNRDYHYWLQRGSLEVENGDLSLAQNFLDQAKALSPEDPFVDTERAYLAFRQANADAATESARQLADEATQTLQSLIARYGDRDPYPYHVLGSQALAWSRRAMAKGQEKAMYLQKLVAVLSSGVDRHPRDEALANLLSDVQREHLSVAIN